MDNLELGHLKHPAISNCFSLPSAQINPINLELLLQFNKETQSLKEVSRPFIPKMNPKAEKCVGDNSKQSQTDWNTDTAAEWDVCWFVGSRCALFDTVFDANLTTTISSPCFLKPFLDTIESSR